MDIKKGKYVIDTNVLLSYPDSLEYFEEVILPIHVIEELDGLKKAEGLLGFQSREAQRKIDSATNIQKDVIDFYDLDIYSWDRSKRDNQILYCCKSHEATMVSNDTAVRIKAEHLGLVAQKFEREIDNDYKGYKEIYMDDEELAKWYSDSEKENIWELKTNEYLMIKDDITGKIIDVWAFGVNGFRVLQYPKKIESVLLGKFISKDVYQNCVLDSMFNNKITMVKGKAGSGKSLLTISYTMHQLEKGKFEKLIVFCNTLPSIGAARMGFLPGSLFEKLADSSIGNMLSSKLGDRQQLEFLCKVGKIDLMPLCDLRGFDSTGMRAIIWISEAQNLDISLAKLAIQRVGEDCQLIIDGDYNTQVDSKSFEGNKNGMKRASQIFSGENIYGEIELNNIYRSRIAEIADKM